MNQFKNPKAAYGSCYAMGRVGDSIDEIYDALKEQAVIFKSAGGYGVSFSDLRPEGALVSTTMGESCGPVEFMDLFNDNTKKIALSGKTKRGANMFSMSVSHPDIEKFILRKSTMIEDESGEIRPKYLEHVNTSVEITDEFVRSVVEDKDWDLIDPHTKDIKKTVKAKYLWDLILDTVHKSADPNILMLDNINIMNPIKYIEEIKSLNPCVTGDTLVPTDKGLVRADELKEGMLTWNPIKKQMDKITKVFNNGLKDIYKITLTNGMELKATKEHKLKTKSGDLVAVEDLSTQDVLEISLDDTLRFVENSYIPEFEQENFGNRNLELNKFRFTNDVDTAWLIGVMVGDGTINANCKIGRHTVTFTIGNTKNGVKTNIERILNDMEVNYRTIETPTSTTQFVICSKNFCNYISFLMEIESNKEGKTSTKDNKKLPSWLFKSSKNIVLSFLAGLIDSDGTVNITNKGSNIAVSSIYKEILYSTQKILLSVGIKSSVSKMNSKRDMKDPRNGKTYKAKETWRITFSTLNKKALAEIYVFMHCSHKKENMKTCIDMEGPNSKYYNSQANLLK
jgi:ribonucleoside-diphosphate reductase alpha chain